MSRKYALEKLEIKEENPYYEWKVDKQGNILFRKDKGKWQIVSSEKEDEIPPGIMRKLITMEKKKAIKLYVPNISAGDTPEEIEKLQGQVLETGQKLRDKRKTGELVFKSPMRDFSIGLSPLAQQVERDVRAQYKFYDALTMWLGQTQHWSPEETRALIETAKWYLKHIPTRKNPIEKRERNYYYRSKFDVSKKYDPFPLYGKTPEEREIEAKKHEQDEIEIREKKEQEMREMFGEKYKKNPLTEKEVEDETRMLGINFGTINYKKTVLDVFTELTQLIKMSDFIWFYGADVIDKNPTLQQRLMNISERIYNHYLYVEGQITGKKPKSYSIPTSILPTGEFVYNPEMIKVAYCPYCGQHSLPYIGMWMPCTESESGAHPMGGRYKGKGLIKPIWIEISKEQAAKEFQSIFPSLPGFDKRKVMESQDQSAILARELLSLKV